MSTSRRPLLSGPSKKISSWVRPGVCEVRASALRPVSALIREDLPTLERPANATSSPAIGGSVSIEGDAQIKCQSPANSFRPCSISFASMSVVMRRFYPSSCPGLSRASTSYGPSKQKTWMAGTSPAMTSWKISFHVSPQQRRSSRLLLGLLRHEGGLEVVEQLDLHAVLAHDVALLQHREQVVPGPVDHEARRKARQHEGEDQRHPVKNHLLGRIRRRRIELHLEPHRDAHDDRPDAEREIMAEHRDRGRIEWDGAEQVEQVGRIVRRQVLDPAEERRVTHFDGDE